MYNPNCTASHDPIEWTLFDSSYPSWPFNAYDKLARATSWIHVRRRTSCDRLIPSRSLGPFPALPGASRSPENCNVHRIWIDPMSISIQYQSFHKLWIWIDMDWSEPNLVLLWQNMANKQRLAGVLYLSHPPNPWPMQITQWDVLPMTIPMLGHRTVGPTLRPHLDFTKRFP